MGRISNPIVERSTDAAGLADEVAAFFDRLARSDVPEEIAQRGQTLAYAISQAAEEGAQRAADAWRESRGARRDVRRFVQRQGREFGRWSRTMWRREIRPGLRRAWSRRAAAYGAAGAAVPVGRQLIEDAAAELGIRRRGERHWGSFFAGILVGAAAGALVAVLTAPKPGRQTRDELASRARGAAETAGTWIRVGPIDENGEMNARQATEVESES